MASAAEQLAANINFGSIAKAEELKKRIWFALGALVVYRFCSYITLPGVDPVQLKILFERMQGGFLDMVNTFSGGSLQRMSIIALNIMPYISASIIMQLMTSMSSKLAQLKKEGEQGRKKINQYTRYGTVLLTVVQGFTLAKGLEAGGVVTDPGWFFELTTVVTLVGGTMFLMWLGEQITQRGIGNGISLIIFAGIVAELPGALAQAFELNSQGSMTLAVLLAILVGSAGLIWFIVLCERAQRRILVQYPKRQTARGGGMQAETSHLPMKLNVAGVIPPIFASSLLMMPLSVAQFYAATEDAPLWLTTLTSYMGQGQPIYIALYVLLIVFFCFFYTSIQFNPEDVADNLKKQNGFVAGIRPGERTAQYLDYVLTRLTVIGSAYLAVVCVIPEVLISNASIPFYIGGTSLLIVVNVTMDTVGQIHSHLMAQQYESLIKKSKIRGKRR